MFRYSAALLLSAIFCGYLEAQVTTGTISGLVQDPTGAAIPGVTVRVENLGTGITRTLTTDERGRYTAANLPLGNYEVQAEQSGFEIEVRSGITLTVGREAVVNLTLKVGNVSEKVTVVGEAPLVESTTSTLGSLVDDRMVRELPLNGRSYDQLALLQPGVVTMGAGTVTNAFDYGAGTRFSVTGSRSYANSFLLDGTDINDHANSTPGGAAGNNLGVDGIREFRIVTNTFSAEYGRSSGGVISAVTMSGSNQLHGSAFEFLRNSAMDARNFFTKGSVPPFRRNQFGGALGGPVKKDKTFFFGTYEGLRQGLGRDSIAFVPTVAAKQGILPTGVVTVSPAIKPFLALYPDPNGRDFGDGSAEFISAPTVVTNEDYVMVRLDHQISEKMSIFGRYSYDNDSVVNPERNNIPVVSAETSAARRQYSTFQLSNILNPTILNSFRFAYNRSNQSVFDLPTIPLGPELSFIPGQTFGNIQLGGGTFAGIATTLTVLGGDNGTPRTFTYNLFQVGDDTNFVKGRHSIKMGANVERIDDNVAYNTSTRGVYSFSNLQNLLTGTPSLFEAVPLGENSYRGFRQTMFGIYGQDDFKMTQRFTLNLGLRWEMVTNPNEVNGKMANLLHPLDSAMTVLRDSFFSVGKKDLQPRVGFAWQLNGSGKTVLRAGFGIFHDHVLPQVYTITVPRDPPFVHTFDAVNPSFPNGYLALTQVGLIRLRLDAASIKEPTKISRNISLQQQLMKDMVFELAYLGSESYHLPAESDQNTVVPSFVNGQPFFLAGGPRANPNFASITRFLFDTTANYNALQVTLRRKSSTGVQYQASYTYSKTIDGKTALTNGDAGQEPEDMQNPFNPGADRGLSLLNASHNFVVTASYPFPFHFQQKPAEVFLGGWIINGIGTFRSGEPFTATAGFNVSRSGDVNIPDRPNLVAGRSNSPVRGGPDKYYDPTAFVLQSPGTYGNLGRNTIIGPGIADVDLSLQKNFRVRESLNVQFRGELFNILNHANFGLPTKSVFTSSGAISGSAGRITTTTTSSRQVQLGLKVIF